METGTPTIAGGLPMTTEAQDLSLSPTCFVAGTRVKTASPPTPSPSDGEGAGEEDGPHAATPTPVPPPHRMGRGLGEEVWRTIETVRAGDWVWTHAGHLRRVLGTQRRPHVGTLLGLRLAGSEAVVWCTLEHRFLTLGLTSPLPSLSVGDRDRATGPVAFATQTASGVPDTEVHRMLGGLDPALVKLARALRKKATEPETKLWECLRARRLKGWKFRRQHPLGQHYISDFYCAETKVSVELDGTVHDSRRAQWADGIRHRQLQEAGVRVVRFRNERVRADLEGVLREISAACESQQALLRGHPHPPTPSPSDGEGAGGEDRPPASIPTPVPPPHRMGRGPGGEVWQQACHLRVGDWIVADETGRAAGLVAIERRLTNEPVFNLSVESNHSFITEAGVAHNCGSGTTM